MEKRKLFIKNAAVLTLAALLLRGLGMVFRIVISNRLGAEGMGLYQIVLSVYLLAATLGSAGLSLAVTRLISEEQLHAGRSAIKKMMGVCLGISVALGSVVGAVLYLAAGVLARGWVGETAAADSLRVLSFSLPFMAVSASLRGYFTARRRLTFASVSQMLEQLIKFGVCMGLMALLGIRDTAFGCFLVMAADTVSEWFSFGFQYIGYRGDCRRLPTAGTQGEPAGNTAKRMAQIALPVAGVRVVGSVLYTVENTLVPNLLCGYLASRGAALAEWGRLKGMGIPVLMFPSTLLASFVLLLVPELSEYRARGETQKCNRLIETSLHITLCASMGIAAAFYLLADEVCELIYPEQGIGFYVRVLAAIVPFIYLENVAEGMLKGLNEQLVTLKYSLINVAVRLPCILVLVPRLGMRGFLWMMVLDNVVTSVLHAGRVLKITGLQVQWGRWVVWPMLCAALSMAAGVRLKSIPMVAMQGYAGRLLWVGAAMAAVYFCGLLLTKSLSIKELAAFCAHKISKEGKDMSKTGKKALYPLETNKKLWYNNQ